jgi:hypothetical protein
VVAVVRRYNILRQVLELGRTALEAYSNGVEGKPFEDVEPADLNDRICVSGLFVSRLETSSGYSVQ